MHELAICRALVSQVNEIARSRAARDHALARALPGLRNRNHAGAEPARVRGVRRLAH
jgi:hypothetical protein